MHGVGHQDEGVLEVVRQVRRHGHLDDVQDEGAGGGEAAAAPGVRLGENQSRDSGQGARVKVV